MRREARDSIFRIEKIELYEESPVSIPCTEIGGRCQGQTRAIAGQSHVIGLDFVLQV